MSMERVGLSEGKGGMRFVGNDDEEWLFQSNRVIPMCSKDPENSP